MILSLTKNEIKIKYKKKIYLKNYLVIFSFLIIISTILLGNVSSTISDSMVAVFNPVNSLYNDNSDVIFTNGVLSNSKLEFTVPVIFANVDNVNGDLIFTVSKSIMVKSIESGVVIDEGVTLDNIKYIKIKHNENTYSEILGLDIVGVKKHDIIKKGEDIATAKEGNKITLKIFINEIQQTSLKVNQSKIICQN